MFSEPCSPSAHTYAPKGNQAKKPACESHRASALGQLLEHVGSGENPKNRLTLICLSVQPVPSLLFFLSADHAVLSCIDISPYPFSVVLPIHFFEG